jgi:hypothetical protein
MNFKMKILSYQEILKNRIKKNLKKDKMKKEANTKYLLLVYTTNL